MITLSTPNGKKIQIMLEELKETYGTECEPFYFHTNGKEKADGVSVTFTTLDVRTNDQKKDWFLRLNPNGTNVPP
jgi:glutathione S-transferase